jgi:hypothetical protein
MRDEYTLVSVDNSVARLDVIDFTIIVGVERNGTFAGQTNWRPVLQTAGYVFFAHA